MFLCENTAAELDLCGLKEPQHILISHQSSDLISSAAAAASLAPSHHFIIIIIYSVIINIPLCRRHTFEH